jgi:molybdate transport system substrate-binding protein
LTCLAVVAAVTAACSSSTETRTLRVAAASDLAKAFDEVGKRFAKATGITPVFDFGSSGLLAKQIEQGAPYNLFAAANKGYADEVVAAGKCAAASESEYARGQVVVWVPGGVAAPTKLTDLTDARFRKIAIANPEHAPYGRAARQALEKAGVWDQIADRVVLADSVQAAMQYAHTRAVDAALVALSLAVVTDGGAFLPVEQALYEPLDQMLVVCGTGTGAADARKLIDYIASPEGREVMTRYGFLLPTEQLRRL